MNVDEPVETIDINQRRNSAHGSKTTDRQVYAVRYGPAVGTVIDDDVSALFALFTDNSQRRHTRLHVSARAIPI